MRTLAALTCLAGLAACTQYGPVERNISTELPFAEISQSVGEDTISFYETGESETTVVMMHGLPANSYLWRNVAPIVAEEAKVVAFDLPGYGKSSVPASGDYTYPGLYTPMAQFLDARPEGSLVLVVTDLASVLGLDYAMRNQERIKGIVLLEAVFMPAEDWYAQIPTWQQAMLSVMRSDWLARLFILDNPILQANTLSIGTIRDLKPAEDARYTAPYADIEYRRVVLEGPGPANVPSGGMSTDEGDIAAAMNRNAAGLRETDIPILLLTAEPGLITQPPAVDYARQNFKNLTVKSIGAGLHYLPEDQPTAIGQAIRDWLAEFIR
ncbi:MAG: alpha/beta fold hydrolase [Pseudomonadota bacterium]